MSRSMNNFSRALRAFAAIPIACTLDKMFKRNEKRKKVSDVIPFFASHCSQLEKLGQQEKRVCMYVCSMVETLSIRLSRKNEENRIILVSFRKILRTISDRADSFLRKQDVATSLKLR